MNSFLKGLKRAAALCIVLSFVLCMSTYAAAPTVFKFTGTTDITDGAVSLLVLKKGTDINNVTGDDIVYVNQGDISGGRYSITVPANFGTQNVDIYSNATGGQFSDLTPIYVSSSGNDSNLGDTQATAVKTFAAAAGRAASKIVLVDDTDLSSISSYTNLPPIEGLTATVKATLPSAVSMKCDLKLDKMEIVGLTAAIYANGYALEMGSQITMADGMKPSVYGGKNGEKLVGDTNVTLLGGRYHYVFGGGNGTAGIVEGNTNIVIGGTVNPGKDINDKNSATLSPTVVFGGGNNAAVTGTVNVTLKDSAVVQYIGGAGNGASGQVSKANIRIDGGKVMNVYGGSLKAETILTNCNTHITMTGGTVESIFGGSFCTPMTGNVAIELIGGTVTRRVYTGCYNDKSLFSWGSSYNVTGTTTLLIYPGILLNQYNLIADSENQMDVGVFAGTRYNSGFKDEINTIIFVDGCYGTQKGNIGAKSGISIQAGTANRSHYVINAGTGGKVYGTYTGGQVYVMPTGDNVGKIDSTYYKNQNATVPTSTLAAATQVTFEPIVGSSSANKISTGVKVDAALNTDVWFGQTKRTIVAVYEVVDNEEVLIGVSVDNTLQKDSFEIGCTLSAGKTYTVGIMIWDENNRPMIQKYTLNVMQ